MHYYALPEEFFNGLIIHTAGLNLAIPLQALFDFGTMVEADFARIDNLKLRTLAFWLPNEADNSSDFAMIAFSG